MLGWYEVGSAVVFLVIVSRLFWRLALLIREGLLDFRVYYQATQVFLAGATPYIHDPAKIAFNYPPSALLFFAPFGLLPFSDAQSIFTLASLVSFSTSGLLLLSLFPVFRAAWKRILLSAILLQAFPTTLTLALGQVNGLLLLCVVGAFLASEKKRNILAGVLWGAASMIKLQFLPLGIYFLLERRFSTFAAGLLVVLAANGILVAVHPELFDYFTRMLPALLAQTASANTVYDQSIRAFFTRLGFTDTGSMLAGGVSAALIVAAITGYLRGGARTTARRFTFFSLFLAVSVIGSSFAWHHHLVFLFPGFIAAWACLPKKRASLALLTVIGSALLILFHFSDPVRLPTTNPFLLSHALIGSLLLIIILLRYTVPYEQNAHQ